MASPARESSEPRPKVGRPPRINRQMIAEAAHELGLDGLTLRDVADHLDVSIAALYHHVSSKEDLMRLAAEYSAARVPRPEDRGQHWAVWLYEWAVYNREAFLARPGLLAQYLDGAISAQTIAGNVDLILGVLVRQGFSILEANAAYELVISYALGTAVSTIREREADKAGRAVLATEEQLAAYRESGALPHVRRLVDAIVREGRPPFHSQVATVLGGIALRQGRDGAEIDALLAEAAAAAPTPAAAAEARPGA